MTILHPASIWGQFVSRHRLPRHLDNQLPPPPPVLPPTCLPPAALQANLFFFSSGLFGE